MTTIARTPCPDPPVVRVRDILALFRGAEYSDRCDAVELRRLLQRAGFRSDDAITIGDAVAAGGRATTRRENAMVVRVAERIAVHLACSSEDARLRMRLFLADVAASALSRLPLAPDDRRALAQGIAGARAYARGTIDQAALKQAIGDAFGLQLAMRWQFAERRNDPDWLEDAAAAVAWPEILSDHYQLEDCDLIFSRYGGDWTPPYEIPEYAHTMVVLNCIRAIRTVAGEREAERFADWTERHLAAWFSRQPPEETDFPVLETG